MNRRKLFRKSVAWTLIAALANPAAMTPAFARDTDIFLNVSGGNTTAEPNILIALGTNDRMNIAEPWREYPGAYDSHIEYLWNDIGIINDTEVTTENASKISTAVQPTNPGSIFGYWAGATLTARRALWNSARIYANTAQPGDPGPRYTWRNYNDASWFYWLPSPAAPVTPAAQLAAESDARLRAPLFNRFRGYQNIAGGTRGGLLYTGSTDYSTNNACAASLTQLIPSTVFNPTSVPRNTGKYLGDQWLRWDPYLALDPVNVAGYPGSDTATGSPLRVQGYLNSSVTTTATWTPPPTTAPLRDNNVAVGTTSQGQPIRLRNTVNSGAGWTDPKADLGGFEFQTYVANPPGFGVNLGVAVLPATSFTLIQNFLAAIRPVYGYSLLTVTGVPAAQVQRPEQFSAWRGNRDNLPAVPAFGRMTGTHAYFDVTTSAPSICDPDTGVLGAATATCINVTSGLVAAHTVTKTRSCTYNGGSTETDALGTVRRRGGNCVAGSVASITCVDPVPAVGPTLNLPSCTGVVPTQTPADPGPCAAPTQNRDNVFIQRDFRSCAWSPARPSVSVAACQWSGRNSTFVEGEGWYYYDGTCQESGAATHCTISGGATRTLGGVTYNNVQGPHANPGPLATHLTTTLCGNALAAGSYFYGSSCLGRVNTTSLTINAGNALTPAAPGVAANCTVSGVTPTLSIHGINRTNVVLNNATSGCGDNTDIDQTCTGRYGAQCDNPLTAQACPATTSLLSGGGTPATNNFYLVANKSASQANLVHDCLGDGASPGYMRAALRTFAQSYNTTVNDASSTAAYTAVSANGVTPNASKKIDVYSVNYLNWKFGPKGPGVNPIGRKTRLQIAKDALSDLVLNTDGVRFGLMVHNRTSGCFAATGTMATGSNSLMLNPDNPGWIVGSTVSVSGAGPGGSTLATTINALNGRAVTLQNSASNTITTGTIALVNPTRLTVSNPIGFAVGNSVRVIGAGAAGADLVAQISAIAASVFTLSASAATAVTNVQVRLAATPPSSPTTTGSILQGGNVLTVASTAGLVIGMELQIAGAGLGGAVLSATYQANGIGPNDLQLDRTAQTDVTDTAITSPRISVYMQTNPCAGQSSNEGGNIAYKVTQMGSGMTDPNYANRNQLILAINAVAAASRTPLTETLYEAYRYYSGRTPRFGTLPTLSASGPVVTTGQDMTAICSAVSADCPALGVYRSPMLNNPTVAAPAGCQKNFVILITNGQPEDDWAANSEIKSLRYTTGPLGTVATLSNVDAAGPLTPSTQFETVNLPYGPRDLEPASVNFDNGYIWLDELAYFMHNADVSPGANNFPGDPSGTGGDLILGRQIVNTYTIGFAGVTAPVVQNAALRAGGIYYTADDSSALSAALRAAVVNIRDWNPTVASPTVPISALNRSENATDIYLAFFQPDPSQAWLGTVKKFRLGRGIADCGGIDDNALCLNGQTVLTNGRNIERLETDPITGSSNIVVDPDAVSFWSNQMDGGRPDRGGTGFQLVNTVGNTPDNRKVYTFISGGGPGDSPSVDLTHDSNAFKMNPLVDLVSKARLGDPVMTDDVQERLINFIRGGNSSNANCSDGVINDPALPCDTWRTWAHFDVQHSKPAIVTYDISSLPAVTQYLYFVSGEGLLHAVDTNDGQEKWTFLIEEALSQISALQADTNGPQLAIADGSIAIFQTDINGDGIVNGADKVYLYFGQRRGGSAYYALDVTNRDTPMFLWKIVGGMGVAGAGRICLARQPCVAEPRYDELGQTWATPFVGKINNLGADTPALIFGGGYDPAEDFLPPNPNLNVPPTLPMGRALYVVNGIYGTVVNSWGPPPHTGAPVLGSAQLGIAPQGIYAIPSDVAAVNSDLDAQGFIDRVYVGDLGGNVWRFDINHPTDFSQWKAKLLANLSSDILAGAERRKFLFPPAVARQVLPTPSYAVYIGSGDREHPRCMSAPDAINPNPCATYVAADKMFAVFDTDLGLAATPAAPITVANLLVRGAADLRRLNAGDANATIAEFTVGGVLTRGWLRDLENGEKVINSPSLFNQRLRFGTYAPLAPLNSCTPPGSGRLNDIDAISGDISDINNRGLVNLTAADRYYTNVTRGYVSSGQIIVIGNRVYHVTVSDGQLRSILVATLGTATKIYWYLEPEI